MYILTQHLKHLWKLIISMFSLLSEGENKYVRLNICSHQRNEFAWFNTENNILQNFVCLLSETIERSEDMEAMSAIISLFIFLELPKEKVVKIKTVPNSVCKFLLFPRSYIWGHVHLLLRLCNYIHKCFSTIDFL